MDGARTVLHPSNMLKILHTQAAVLRERYGVQFSVVGVADSTGAAIDLNGLDVVAMHAIKANRNPISSLPAFGRPGMSGLEVVQQVEADILLEATPVDLKNGDFRFRPDGSAAEAIGVKVVVLMSVSGKVGENYTPTLAR